MIELQRLTGMRPGEVVIMRTGDIETGAAVWSYTPSEHKTEHHGKSRKVFLGPRAQAILREWLRTDLAAYLFSPAEAEAERLAAKREARRTPVQPSQRCRKRRRPRRTPGERYDVDSYRRAIHRSRDDAGVPRFSPHRLRHSLVS